MRTEIYMLYFFINRVLYREIIILDRVPLSSTFASFLSKAQFVACCLSLHRAVLRYFIGENLYESVFAAI